MDTEVIAVVAASAAGDASLGVKIWRSNNGARRTSPGSERLWYISVRKLVNPLRSTLYDTSCLFPHRHRTIEKKIEEFPSEPPLLPADPAVTGVPGILLVQIADKTERIQSRRQAYQGTRERE